MCENTCGLSLRCFAAGPTRFLQAHAFVVNGPQIAPLQCGFLPLSTLPGHGRTCSRQRRANGPSMQVIRLGVTKSASRFCTTNIFFLAVVAFLIILVVSLPIPFRFSPSPQGCSPWQVARLAFALRTGFSNLYAYMSFTAGRTNPPRGSNRSHVGSRSRRRLEIFLVSAPPDAHARRLRSLLTCS